jgi:hypothetical protein
VLRFAGELRTHHGRSVIAVELDARPAVARLRSQLVDLYGCPSEVLVLPSHGVPGSRGGERYLVRIAAHAAQLARRTGLVDHHGRPVRGMPPAVVAGSVDDAAAAWRGAFLARGSLPDRGRTASPAGLEIACPSLESALALVGAARRMGVAANARESRDGDRVVIRDDEAIVVLLTRLGAAQGVAAWQDWRDHRVARNAPVRLAAFEDANSRRASVAAASTTARVRRALQIMGRNLPDHLLAAARLRLEYEHDSLEQLGQRATPPMTKDAMAGRLRRLLTTADRLAAALGIPDTREVVTGGGEGRLRTPFDASGHHRS